MPLPSRIRIPCLPSYYKICRPRWRLAREHKAFVRAKKVKTPEELLRLVLLYCGLDQSLRTGGDVYRVV